MPHPYALRTPWYIRARNGHLSVLDPEARRPAIQKYAVPDFVERQLVRDPRTSLTFADDGDDVWSYPVPVGFPGPGPGRLRFATHQMITTPVRKLYQPNHDRFYALTIEVFCDAPGLPRPAPVDGLEVRFVVRRERLVVEGDDPKDVAARRAKLRTLARDLTVDLHKRQGRPGNAPDVPLVDDVERVASAQRASDALTDEQVTLLTEINAKYVVEGWTVGPDGRGTWTRLPEAPDEPPRLLPGEQEMPMWRLPPREDDCPAGRTRSLWFGLVPTISGDVDLDGRPKFDDDSCYRMWCFVRQRPGPGRERCGATFSWSDGTRPYRLASFFDPAGTANRRFTITMPDFRALAARAGQPQAGGGVEIVRPPGSQLNFQAPAPGSLPTQPERDGSGAIDLGSVTSRCTFALELLMIVAMFLFSLFLPIVVLLFQLWWLLLLKFCWPPNAQALQILNAHLGPPTNGTIAGMGAGSAERDALDEVVEVDGAAAGLAAVPSISTENATATALVASAQPDPVPAPVVPPPAPEPPDDPLCPVVPP